MIENGIENGSPVDDIEWAKNQLLNFKRAFDPILAKFLDEETVEAETINPQLGRLLRV